MSYDTQAVIELLRKRQGALSMRAFARQLGVSAPYISDIYRNRRDPGPSILEFLGLVKKQSRKPKARYEKVSHA